MKKALTLLLVMGCMISLVSCNEKEEIAENNMVTEITTENITDSTKEEAFEYNEGDFDIWDSPIGYSMDYNSKLFTIETTDNSDFFSCNIDESSDSLTYFSVQKYLNSDMQAVAQDIATKFGVGSDKIEDTIFGHNLIDAKSIYIDKETDGIRQIQVIYVVADGDNSLVIEASSYVGQKEEIDWCFERMLGSFKLNN